MIVFHFDVLAHPETDGFIKRQPSTEGRRLWNTFFEEYKGRMVVVADEETDLTVLQEWLKREGFKPSLVHIASPFCRSGKTPRSEAVWYLSSNIGKVTWYIDADAACVSDVLRLGIPSLLVAVPSVARPEWHEKQDIRAWDSVVEEQDKQALFRSEKTWDEDVA